MEDLYVKTISDMGVSLAELAVKGTASAVNKKIKAAKEIKEIEKLRTTYDELINEILNEREEAVRLAQPSTLPLHPVNPDNACPLRITAAAGT